MWWLRAAFQSAPWIRDMVATSRLQDLVKLWSLEANQDGLRISQSWQCSSQHGQDVRHSPFTASRLESKRAFLNILGHLKKHGNVQEEQRFFIKSGWAWCNNEANVLCSGNSGEYNRLRACGLSVPTGKNWQGRQSLGVKEKTGGMAQKRSNADQ